MSVTALDLGGSLQTILGLRKKWNAMDQHSVFKGMVHKRDPFGNKIAGKSAGK